jgi:hypothetical protein
MWRKNDASKDDLDSVAQRLREERPQASPLELDRIKMTAMARARGAKTRNTGARRLAVGALSMGMLVAGAGGVVASGTGNSGAGNAATAQYSGCATSETHGASAASDFDCTSNETTSTETTTSSTSSVATINYVPPTGSGGVLGTKTTARDSRRHFTVHFFAAKGRALKKLVVIVNGKVVKQLTGNGVAIDLDFVGFPCSSVKQTVTLRGTLANGKKITETRQYNLCK